MTAPTPRWGELWVATTQEGKRRPVIILTRNPMGELLSSVIVAPVTSTIRDIPVEVRLGPEHGLAKPSAANLDSTTNIPRNALHRRIRRLDDNTMRLVCEALAFAVDCA